MITLAQAMEEERAKFASAKKICKQCKWFIDDPDNYSSHRRNMVCSHPKFLSPIDDLGVPIEYARLESEKCGPTGKLWEPKPTRAQSSLLGWLRGAR